MPNPSFVKAVSVGRNTVTASCQLSELVPSGTKTKREQPGSACSTESLEGPYDWEEAIHEKKM